MIAELALLLFLVWLYFMALGRVISPTGPRTRWLHAKLRMHVWYRSRCMICGVKHG